MAHYKTSRIIPAALILIIVVIAIAALISVARAVFFSGSSEPTTSQDDVSKEALLSTTADRAVRMTVRGAIVADENFHSYQITVTPSSRALVTYNGYLDTVVDQVKLGNNIPAYEEFVFALDRANLSKGEELTGDKNDIRGICATGNVYQFEIMNKGEAIKNLWTSTCANAKGSLNAKFDQLKVLFYAQIPNASDYITKIRL